MEPSDLAALASLKSHQTTTPPSTSTTTPSSSNDELHLILKQPQPTSSSSLQPSASSYASNNTKNGMINVDDEPTIAHQPVPLSSFAHASTLQVIITLLLYGIVSATNHQFAPIYLQYRVINDNCRWYTTEVACSSLERSPCAWNATQVRCINVASLRINCTSYDGNANECEINSGQQCAYDYVNNLCFHPMGHTALESGLIGGLQHGGGLIGSSFFHLFLERVGYSWSGRGLCLLLLLTSIFTIAGRLLDQLPLLIIGFFCFGAASYNCTILAPMYCEQNLRHNPSLAQRLKACFTSFQAIGAISVALYGFGAQPWDPAAAADMEWRFIGLFLFPLGGAVALLALSWCIPESPVFMQNRSERREKSDSTTTTEPVTQQQQQCVEETEEPLPTSSHEPTAATKDTDRKKKKPKMSCCSIIKYLAFGFIVCQSWNVSGIIPLFAFAPSMIRQGTGISPLLGNLFLMLSVGAATTASALLAKFNKPRGFFLSGICGSAAACGVAAFGLLPIFENQVARFVITGVGLVSIFFIFYCLDAPYWFVWVARVFPPEIRELGVGFCSAATGVVGVISIVVYPTAVVGMSGGISGDQRIGHGGMLCIFAGLGFLVFGLLLFLLKNDEVEEGSGTSVAEEVECNALHEEEEADDEMVPTVMKLASTPTNNSATIVIMAAAVDHTPQQQNPADYYATMGDDVYSPAASIMSSSSNRFLLSRPSQGSITPPGTTPEAANLEKSGNAEAHSLYD